MPYVVAAVVLAVLVAVYVLTYKLNEKTEAPEGCEFPEGFSGCGGCKSATCAARRSGGKDGTHA
jgi:hypothetical protein